MDLNSQIWAFKDTTVFPNQTISLVSQLPDSSSVGDLDPRYGIVFFLTRFSDPGSRISNPYFWELSDNFFVVKGTVFFCQLAQFFSVRVSYSKIKSFFILRNFCSFVLVVGYGMDKKSGTGFRDKYPGSVSKPNNFPMHPNGQILGLARFGKPNQTTVHHIHTQPFDKYTRCV